MEELKQRIIQEFVPGKQVTIAHVIASPKPEIYKKMGLEEDTKGAIGILTITPGEATIIAADIATKSAGIEIGFIDRFSGALLITGDISSVEESLKNVIYSLETLLKFTPTELTRS
ncbi:MAG: BMC domain-containing protein [Tissierellia bacterium]|nr:BMC domain-containing protein [Tissierellia bacterium]